MLTEEKLRHFYLVDKLSMMEIGILLGCSAHKVAYWMYKYGIPRRSISEAVYQRCNPNGDPFTINPVETLEDAELYGKGIGLYWGEGTKASIHSVRLGNTDPELLNTFMNFLMRFFNVRKSDFKFALQVFTDIDPAVALDYWARRLDVPKSSFGKVHTTISGSIGTYRKKSQYGVVTVHYHNKKLRDIMVGLLPR